MSFKFEVGQLVTCGGFEQMAKHLPSHDRPVLPGYFITERLLQECPGGIQRHYQVRCLVIRGGSFQPEAVADEKYIRFLEEELVAYPEPTPKL